MKISITIAFIVLCATNLFAQTADEIVQKAYLQSQGTSQYSQMTMQIIRPRWQKTMNFKICSLGTDYSLVLVTEPAKDKGQTFLKVKDQMWMWNPTINRSIKMGESMMSQGWMNSDYSNNELLNSGSILKDYDKKIVATENVSGKDCWAIELVPKKGTNIIWGKQKMWISKDGYLSLKTEFYDEDNELVKTFLASDIKTLGGRQIPTKYEIITQDNLQNRTIVTLNNIIFDVKVQESFFTIQNMQKGMQIVFPQKN